MVGEFGFVGAAVAGDGGVGGGGFFVVVEEAVVVFVEVGNGVVGPVDLAAGLGVAVVTEQKRQRPLEIVAVMPIWPADVDAGVA